MLLVWFRVSFLFSALFRRPYLVRSMPTWYERDRANAGSHHAPRDRWGKGYGKGHSKGSGKGYGYGANARHDYRSNPYGGNQPNGFERAISRSFQSAVSSTLECAISEGFNMVMSKLSKESQRDEHHSSPPARAGSTLTRVIAGFFSGSQEEAPTKTKQKDDSATSSNTSSAEGALQAALEQQTQTMQMMASLVKSSVEANQSQTPEATRTGCDLIEIDRNAQISQLQDQVAFLTQQLQQAKNSKSDSDDSTLKPKVQSKLPFKPAAANN